MAKKIKITATGGNDASELTDCYFLPTNTTGYVLFGKDDLPIVTVPMPVQSGGSFTFNKLLSTDTFTWAIPNPAPGSQQFSINNTAASGSWWNGDPSITADESGSFTAQVTFDDEEEESASSATA